MKYKDSYFQIWQKIFGFIFSIVYLIFIGIMSLLNYSASITLILGTLLTEVIIWLVGWSRIKSIIRFSVTYGILLLLAWLAYMNLFPVGYLGIGTIPGVLKDYQAVIKPIDENLTSFTVQEIGTLDSYQFIFPSSQPNDSDFSQPMRLGERLVQSHQRGFLLREVSLQPLNVDDTGEINVVLPDGSFLYGRLCGLFYEMFSTHPDIFIPQCPSAKVELVDFPKDSFYSAKDSENILKFLYVDTETINWNVLHIDRGITFSYIPPPFHHLRPILSPFVGISFWSQQILVIVGMISTFIATSILKPTIVELINDKFKLNVEERMKKKPKNKFKFVIFSDGKEKEIEVEQKES